MEIQITVSIVFADLTNDLCFALRFGIDWCSLFEQCSSYPSEPFWFGLVNDQILVRYINTQVHRHIRGSRHTSMLVLRVTALRITLRRSSMLGVTGVGIGTSSCERICRRSPPSSLSSASESCIAVVPRLRLSLLEFTCFLVCSSTKYPPLMLRLLSMLLSRGGDEGPGEYMELCPLALLELILFLRDFTRARW